MVSWAAIAVLAIGSFAGDGAVGGVIRSDRYEVVEGVRVEVLAGDAVAWSDASGRYRLEGLEPGAYRVRFSRFAYDPLTLTVTIPERGALDLDVQLRTRFVLLPRISVLASQAQPRNAGPFAPGFPEVGSRTFFSQATAAGPFASLPDALAALKTMPGIDVAEELPTQLHVRGGSADENLVLVDGLPVYNTIHTAGVLSSIAPEAVAGVTMHAGVQPARFGGRLSSVIDMRTATPDRERVRVRGGIGVPDARTVVEAPLLADRSALLVSGRRTTYDVVHVGRYTGLESSGFEDIFAKISADLFSGTLEIVALGADNWFSSKASSDIETGVTPDPGVPVIDAHNSVRWSTRTDGFTWSRESEQGSVVELRGWRAGTRSGVEWGAAAAQRNMRHELQHWGAAGAFEWVRSASIGRVGLAVERLGTRYTVRADSAVEIEGLSATASPTHLTSYIEHRWIPRDRWVVNNGVRAIVAEDAGFALEPRVSLHYQVRPELMLAGGYGRTHQYVQSLSNEESLLNAAYAVEPLIANGPDGTPVARSDQVAVELDTELSDAWHLVIDAYARWTDGIALVAPTTAEPFATSTFEIGSATARGLGSTVTYDGERTDIEAVVEWTAAHRRVRGLEYRPRLERRRSIALGAAYHITTTTTIRTALHAAAGAPTSVLSAGGFDWEVFDDLTGEVEFTGTPMAAPGALNTERLPAYVRVDLGVRRSWELPAPGAGNTTLTASLDVLNVLDNRNVVGRQLAAEPTGSSRDLLLRPTTILIGVDWRF